MNIHSLYRPFLKYFRTKRMQQFQRWFKVSSETQILDAGGDLFNWSLLEEPAQVVFLNLYAAERDGCSWVVADSCHLPFGDEAFDIVYSNSVIEHLGNLWHQQETAEEIRRVGRRYYVQTPNRHFFVEPHLLTPFIHYFPKAIRRHLLRNFTIWGLITRPTAIQCKAFIEEVRLLNEKEFEMLFPDAEIWQERALGFSKSLIAVKF